MLSIILNIIQSFAGKFVTNALGSKTSSAIGLILGWIIYAYADVSKVAPSLIPAQYATIIQTCLAIGTAIFGAMVVIPGVGTAPDLPPHPLAQAITGSK